MPESKIITSESMVDNHDLRNELIARTEVLDKVKKLLLIPEMNCMTIRQVADYYEVDIDTIKRCCQRNRTEIEGDGVANKTPKVFKDLLTEQNVPLVQNRTNLVIQIDDNTRLEIPNRGIKCFSKRAILRIGMLLRDSKIAKRSEHSS